MLTIYRRHLKSCPHSSRKRKNCESKCPIWVQGTLGQEAIRKSLDLTSWEAASNLIATWTAKGEIGASSIPSIAEAIQKYLADAEARHLKPATLSKLRRIFEKELLGFARDKGFRYLKQLDTQALTEFRSGWKDGALAASKKYERVKGFFYFCIRNDWMRKNPMESLRAPKVAIKPTLPFTDEDMAQILDACEKYPLKGIYGRGNRIRLRAFVLLLRYSGLRIGDAVSLKRSKVKDGKLFLYSQKTGTPVRLPLPEQVLSALAALPEENEYYFWSGKGLLKSAVSDWQRALRTLFELAEIEGGHAHRLRDTFAVSLLVKGIPLDQVSVLLGHSSIRVTEKHYAPWVKARQDVLEAAVKGSWS